MREAVIFGEKYFAGGGITEKPEDIFSRKGAQRITQRCAKDNKKDASDIRDISDKEEVISLKNDFFIGIIDF